MRSYLLLMNGATSPRIYLTQPWKPDTSELTGHFYLSEFPPFILARSVRKSASIVPAGTRED